MKTYPFLRLALIALTGVLIVPVLSAAESTLASALTARASLPAAVRAKGQIGAAVFAADGERIGTVGDYVLQFNSLPQLRYVIVKSGATAGHHAEQRAIPADAITLVERSRAGEPQSNPMCYFATGLESRGT